MTKPWETYIEDVRLKGYREQLEEFEAELSVVEKEYEKIGKFYDEATNTSQREYFAKALDELADLIDDLNIEIGSFRDSIEEIELEAHTNRTIH
jgi:DNA repair exonuclease SbcCD ATPase subunit